MVQIKFKKLSNDAVIPKYVHRGDSGMDLCSVEDLLIDMWCFGMIRTGLSIELPEGVEAQIRPRSGLALKYGITVLNTPGTIDSNYRGEIGVILVNHGRQPFKITKGMKIAQLVIVPVLMVEVSEVLECSNLSDTSRGDGGFGSTGI